MRDAVINLSYILASVLFIFGLKMMSRQHSARRGNLVSALGMLIAILATLISNEILSYQYIIAGLIIGSIAGTVSAMRVPMTSMPEFVALFNGFGGLASLLVGWAEYHKQFAGWKGMALTAGDPPVWYLALVIFITILIGGVTFTGSMVAYAKLAGRLPGKPILFPKQQLINAAAVLGMLLFGLLFMLNPGHMYFVFFLAVLLSLALGVLTSIPVGGADMPVVICLLNSYSGLAACASGFVISNNLLIVTGSLVGASGIVLTQIMCKAMNRSLANVLFGGLGTASGKATAFKGEAKSLTPEDAYYILEAANSVVFVPGYGMAVAQAQHVVRELGELLEKNGAEVKYAIHPVAGRMPGHMNVLLAEANVPYEQLVEMDDINPIIETVDVAIVIGANDVVNPAARTDKNCAIYGMPIINVDHAKTVFVLKRSLASGFAGVDNPLFFNENTRMLFGDAKATVQALVSQMKES